MEHRDGDSLKSQAEPVYRKLAIPASASENMLKRGVLSSSSPHFQKLDIPHAHTTHTRPQSRGGDGRGRIHGTSDKQGGQDDLQ